MAKNPTFFIKIEDKEVQAFSKHFKDLTDRMTAMTKQWKDLGDTIEKASARIAKASSTVQSANQSMINMVNNASKLNKHFAKLGGMIGGIVMMLGGGTWLGMDKIAQRMVDTRRRLMGLGGADYGKTQAVQTFGKGLLDDPNAFLKNIAKAKTDYTSDQYRALKFKGFTDEEIKSMKDPDLAMEYLRRTSKKKMEGPGVLPVYGQGQLETSMMNEQDIRRLHGKQGEEVVGMMAKHFQASQGLTDQDLLIWEKFWESVKTFQIRLDTEWTKALEPLAPAGSKLIEAITKLTTAFLQWDKVTTSIQQIATGMEWLADFMSKPTWKEAWEKLESTLKDLFKDQKTAAESAQSSVLRPLERFTKPIDEFLGYPHAPPGGSAKMPAQSPAAATAQSWYQGIQNFLTKPFGGGAKTGASTSSSSFSFGQSNTSNLMSGPVRGSVPSAGGGGVAPMPAPFSFNNAVQGQAPGKTSAVDSMSSKFASMLPKGGGSSGPLDSNNWQNTRTASLVVRGIPSANMFVAATGMAG